jgi:cytochrome c551
VRFARHVCIALLVSVAFIFGCEPMSSEQVAKKQSYDAGKAYYKEECARCHLENGEGVGTLYPPIRNSDYLKSHFNELGCIIYNGMKGPLVVNKLQYNWPMPKHVNMDDFEFAALLNYIRQRLGYSDKYITPDQARAIIISCRSKSPVK